MRIGLYGMPTAGKTYILDKVDSNKLLLYNICNITCIDDDIIFITL